MNKNKQEFSPIIREVKEKDAKEIFNLLNDLDSETKNFFHPHPFNFETINSICKSQDDHYFVMILNKQIIGYSFLRLFGYKIPSLGLVIKRGFTRKGYGTILMNWTINQARHLGYKKVILKTYKENYPAQRLYKKFGFTIFGESKDKREYRMELIL